MCADIILYFDRAAILVNIISNGKNLLLSLYTFNLTWAHYISRFHGQKVKIIECVDFFVLLDAMENKNFQGIYNKIETIHDLTFRNH